MHKMTEKIDPSWDTRMAPAQGQSNFMSGLIPQATEPPIVLQTAVGDASQFWRSQG